MRSSQRCWPGSSKLDEIKTTKTPIHPRRMRDQEGGGDGGGDLENNASG